MNDQTNGLIDIVEPAAPLAATGAGWLWIALSLAVFVLFLLGLFMLWKMKWPAYQALKRLRKLQQQTKAGELTPHESIFMLALELRHGLGVKRLLADSVPAHFKPQEHTRWPEFMHGLDAMLYQHKAEQSAEKLAELFIQTEYWLRRYSRKSTLKKMGS
jgi:hypothetical protein